MEIRESTVALRKTAQDRKKGFFTGQRDESTTDKKSDQSLISVIVPAHNEEGYLAGTLEALQKQDYGCFEVVVVANGCTDQTVEEARGRCNRLVVLSQKSLGISRNLGARLARGELLVFLDADTILEPTALREIAQNFSRNCAAGTIKGKPDCEPFKYRLIYGMKNSIHRLSIHPGSSGVMLCWKKHFMKIGGFDETMEMRENSELMRRLMKFGRYKFIGKCTATTSMRRYDQRGCGKMVWMWFKTWCQSFFIDLRNRQYEAVR